MSTFSSVRLDDALRDRLLDLLTPVHAAHPLLPDDPRRTAGRAATLIQRLGLTAVRIRGTVSWRGVEVDHVWLAVDDGVAAPGWVLDVAFPLHASAFAGALAGYVAGTVSTAELAAVAATAPLEDRVLGDVPAPAVYRGQPFWGSSN